MNRELTKRETAMLLFLVILVIALGYFKLIFEPIQDQTARYQSDTVQEQSELELELVRLDQMQKMQQKIDELRKKEDENCRKVEESYGGMKVLMRLLSNCAFILKSLPLFSMKMFW